MKFLIIFLYVLVSVSGLTCFKLGSQQVFSFEISSDVFGFRISWLSLVGVVLYILSFLMYLGLTSKNNLTYLTPVSTGLSSLLILLVSLFIFKEQMTYLQWGGWCLIIVGVILMNLKK